MNDVTFNHKGQTHTTWTNPTVIIFGQPATLPVFAPFPSVVKWRNVRPYNSNSEWTEWHVVLEGGNETKCGSVIRHDAIGFEYVPEFNAGGEATCQKCLRGES